LTACPHLEVTDDVRSLLELADYAESGHLPNGGGALDQTQSCIDGFRAIRRHQSHWRMNPPKGE
jgi:hypothetical protein